MPSTQYQIALCGLAAGQPLRGAFNAVVYRIAQ